MPIRNIQAEPARSRLPAGTGAGARSTAGRNPVSRSATTVATRFPARAPAGPATANQIPDTPAAASARVAVNPAIEFSIRIATASWLRSIPIRMRVPSPAGMVAANRHSATVIAHRSAGEVVSPITWCQPSATPRVSASPATAAPTTPSTPSARRMVARATGSAASGPGRALTVVTAAPMPRSANGNSRPTVAIRVTTPKIAGPVCDTTTAVLARPATATTGVPAMRISVP
ncbi:hypothetical protein SKPI104516_00175 [Skermania piniformis]